LIINNYYIQFADRIILGGEIANQIWQVITFITGSNNDSCFWQFFGWYFRATF
ncbi:MAG: hypothetical protein GY869_10175, partial [Planctomycetes bacterium]|nr:hypothetical protein [Planctomycetota bacterium]